MDKITILRNMLLEINIEYTTNADFAVALFKGGHSVWSLFGSGLENWLVPGVMYGACRYIVFPVARAGEFLPVENNDDPICVEDPE